MKNQNKIDTNISKSDEKQVAPKDTLYEVSNNINQNTYKVENSNENFIEISNDKSLSKKNEQNNGLNSNLKDLYLEGKSDTKPNFDLPYENNTLQTLKGNFDEKNINEINQYQNKIYNEGQLGIQNANVNLNPSMILNSIIPEKDSNNLNSMNSLFIQSGEREGPNDKTNINLQEVLQLLSSFGDNINIEALDPNILNNLIQYASLLKNAKEVQNNENALENFLNQLNTSKEIDTKKDENKFFLQNQEYKVNPNESLIKSNEKSEMIEEFKNISDNINILNHDNKLKKESDYDKNKLKNPDQQVTSSNNIKLDNKCLENLDKNLIASLKQQKSDNPIFSQNLNPNEDVLANNFNYLNFLVNTGDLANLKQSKLNTQTVNPILENPNITYPFINTLNGLIPTNQLNSQEIPILNHHLLNPVNIQESENKLGTANLINPNNPRGPLNFHIHFHFNLNIINRPKNIQNQYSSQMANTADIRKNSNDQSLSEKTDKNKEELIQEKDNSSNSINLEQGYIQDLEKLCNKLNYKIVESNPQDDNKTFSANVANFNSVVNKNIVNPDPKFNDLAYYMNLFNTPEMNSSLLNLVKHNLDVNKISEEYKNLIFNVAANSNAQTSLLDSKQSYLGNNLPFNNSINNMNNGSNMPLNIDNLSSMSNLFSSLLGNNPAFNLNNQVGNANNLFNDPMNLLQNPNAIQQLQSLLSNPEMLKNDNLALLNGLYNMSNINGLNNLNEKNLRNNNSYNNENLYEMRNNVSYNNTDKDLINELNNFNRINNNSSLFNSKNSNQNLFNQNKSSVFLSNKIKRHNSNNSDSPDNKNYKSFRSEGRYCDSNYGSNNNYEELNEMEENYYKNRAGYGNMSQEGKNYSVHSRNNDDIYDFIKTKKFHIKKFSKTEQALNNANLNNSQGSNFPSMSGNPPNVNNTSNLSLPENKSNKENRKFKADSIHKKIKVNVLKYLKATVCEFIPNKRINNLSQEIITNVNISFNKELLEKQLYKIYEDDYLENDGLECLENIKRAMAENREFFELMNMTLKDFIIYKYWKSDFHKKKLSKIFQQESYEYYVNYEYLDREFINYFLSNKGNKRKILKNKKGTSQDGKSEYSVTQSNNA